MSYSVIDSKTQKWSAWPWEYATITISLVNMGAGKLGLNYSADFTGTEVKDVSGGPIEISGNGKYIVNPDPKVEVDISNFTVKGTYASCHVNVIGYLPFPIGTQTLYSQTLGGNFDPAATGFAAALPALNTAVANHQAGSGTKQKVA